VLGSLAVLAVAALAGCGHAGGNDVTSGTGTQPGQTPASSGTQAPAGGAAADNASPATPCVTSAAKGGCGPYVYRAVTPSMGQTTTVGQNVWNPIPGWSQSLHATDPGNWYTTASMPAGNTAVVSFPNTGQNYPETPLSGFTSIYSSFAESMHPTKETSAEAAYDIWLNNWNNEVMIQHDIVNRGSCPVLTTTSFGGSGGVPAQQWNLCKYGSELIWQLAGHGQQAGSVNVLAMLTWLIDNGYLPGKTTLTAISYGFELCSTGGKPETFTVSKFSITAARS
jgi:hypothetical protein